jgi:hypothetical protein
VGASGVLQAVLCSRIHGNGGDYAMFGEDPLLMLCALTLQCTGPTRKAAQAGDFER